MTGPAKAHLDDAAGASGNAQLVRDLNERAVLAVLRRHGAASKTEIAEAIGLSTNAVGLIAGALLQRGLVTTGAKRVGYRGHPATPLVLDATGAHAIGILIGRGRLDAVLVDFSGTVLASRHRALPLPPPDIAVALVADEVAALRAELPAAQRSRLTGIGIAVPSNLDRWRRELGIPDRIADAWSGCDLQADLSAALEAPIMVVNDGTAIAAAELYAGAGRLFDDFATITIGTALGGGLVLDGAVRLGRHENAADFGLMPVAPSTLASAPHPPAGLPDILLDRASLHALLRHLDERDVDATDADGATDRGLARALKARPDLVDAWIGDCAAALVRPIFTISALLDLQAVVVGGYLPDRVMDALIARLATDLSTAAPEARRPPEVIRGCRGKEAEAVGAALLLFERAFAAEGGRRGRQRPGAADADYAAR